MKTKKWIALLSAVCIAMSGCGNSNKASNDEDKLEDDAASAVDIVEKEEEDIDTDTDEDDLASVYADIIKEAMEESFGENCNVELDQNAKYIFIEVWADGVAQAGSLALEGNEEMLTTWNETVETLRETCEGMYNEVYENIPNYHISFMVLNDEDLDYVLMSFEDTKTTYDAVNGDY